MRRGYELNDRLFALPVEKHQGALPPEHSFVQLQPDNVVLTAVKKAEDDNALVLRFYEWAGKETDIVLHLYGTARAASETDLMEHHVADLSLSAGSVTVHTKPYEIKTVKLELAEGQPARK